MDGWVARWMEEFTLTFTTFVLQRLRRSFHTDILKCVLPGQLQKGELWKRYQWDISTHYTLGRPITAHKPLDDPFDKYSQNRTPLSKNKMLPRVQKPSSLNLLHLSSTLESHRQPSTAIKQVSTVTERGQGSPKVTPTSPSWVFHICVHICRCAHILKHFSMLYHA